MKFVSVDCTINAFDRIQIECNYTVDTNLLMTIPVDPVTSLCSITKTTV